MRLTSLLLLLFAITPVYGAEKVCKVDLSKKSGKLPATNCTAGDVLLFKISGERSILGANRFCNRSSLVIFTTLDSGDWASCELLEKPLDFSPEPTEAVCERGRVVLGDNETSSFKLPEAFIEDLKSQMKDLGCSGF